MYRLRLFCPLLRPITTLRRHSLVNLLAYIKMEPSGLWRGNVLSTAAYLTPCLTFPTDLRLSLLHFELVLIIFMH